jgi:alkylation response protein AidB-like acyl-CoA dehydrogenase
MQFSRFVIVIGIETGSAISPQAWQRVVRRALVATAAELVGVGRHLLDSAVAYAKERQQFGRAIGSFQGLQWKLVDAALELERAAAAVAWAAMCVDADTADADGITASGQNGVLQIVIPKRAESTPRRIQVEGPSLKS